MVRYCCREHQLAHFPDHKSNCKELKQVIAKMDDEKAMLLVDRSVTDPDDMFYTGDPFENCVGHFWGILETRPYMRARGQVIRVLEEIGSHTSLTAAVAHIMDCLRLCRSDNMGLRDLVPALLLRLNRDQECYDFIKW
jgi:hypothetical protein